MEKVRICLVGAPSILSTDGRVLVLKNRKAMAIIAYLARRPGYTAPRTTLAALLWSRSSEVRAKGSLRQCLRQINRAQEDCGSQFLVAGKSDIRLAEQVFETDIDEAGDAAGETALPAPFLEGYEYLDPCFSDWLYDEREVLETERSSGEWPITAANTPPGPAIGQMPFGAPRLSVVKDDNSQAVSLSVQDNILYQLSHYRHLELFVHDELPALRIRHDGFGDYRINFRFDAAKDLLFLEMTEYQSGRIVYFDFIHTGTDTDAERDGIITRIVGRIDAHIVHLHRQRPTTEKLAYDHWCTATAYLNEFHPRSDERALKILNDLEAQRVDFGPAYAAKASVFMKQVLFHPNGRTIDNSLDATLHLSDLAVRQDPWEPFNHQVHGWALLQSDDIDGSILHFDRACELNPIDPRPQMAAAEAKGEVGRIDEALAHAERGLKLSNTPMRYFYGYLATIYFAAGNYEECERHCRRGPVDNFNVEALRISALANLGRRAEAKDQLVRLVNALEGTSRGKTNKAEIEAWLHHINQFKVPKTHKAFTSGIDQCGLFDLDR